MLVPLPLATSHYYSWSVLQLLTKTQKEKENRNYGELDMSMDEGTENGKSLKIAMHVALMEGVWRGKFEEKGQLG